MRTICQSLGVLAALAMLAQTLAAADDPSAKAKERELIALLKSDRPAADKALACKQLAVYGSGEAVPQLAPLLADERLSSWARIALEVIPGAEADEALRKAAGSLKGRVLIGVVNSIGVRRDAQAVDLLAQRLQDADGEVASAAAVSLGKIGTPAARQVLRQSLSLAAAAVRSAVAEGCVLCAERMLSAGQGAEAARLCDEVRQADLPKQRILEATRLAILARGSDGIPLLLEQLRSTDKGLLQIGLMVARELPGREVADSLGAEVGRAAPERGALLLAALADRGDATVTPAVLQAARSGAKPVRLAAIAVVGRRGDASAVETLLSAAADADAELAQQARAALVTLPGENVNREIAARLAKAEGKLLGPLIELAGERRIEATAALLKAVESPDGEIRAAALAALGATIGPDALGTLVERAVAPQHPEDAPAALRALRAAAVRMPSRDAAAGQIVAAMNRASVEARSSLLETLAAVGGGKALEAVAAAVRGKEPALQDTGSRLLGSWMTADAAPVLLELAKSAGEDKYQVRALRGYVRIARQFRLPVAERAQMCRQALAAAKRDEERKLVLEVLERYPAIETLKVAVDAAQTPALKNDAARAALVIVGKLPDRSAEVQTLLARVGMAALKLEIVKAEYGAGSRLKDVTELVRKQAKDLPLVTLPSPSYNAAFGGDPAPNVRKQLKIQYRAGGKAAEATFEEDAVILLPLPQ